MANLKVSGEAAFQVGGPRFCIGQTADGYTLNYSVDGVHYTAWEEMTPADTDVVVVNSVPGLYYKLVGNTSDDVRIIY